MYSEEDNTPDISRGTGWIPDDFYNRICEQYTLIPVRKHPSVRASGDL